MNNVLKLSGALKVGNLASAPSNPQEGYIYFNTTTGKFQMYENGSFREVSAEQIAAHLTNDAALKHDADQVDYQRADGSRKNIQADATSGNVEAALSDLDDAIGALDATPTNYTPADAGIVADHLAAIDAALATAGSKEFSDADFRIQDNADNTKKIAFEASAVAASTTRTISMPDADVDLGKVASAIQKDGTVAFIADQSMGGYKLTEVGAIEADADLSIERAGTQALVITGNGSGPNGNGVALKAADNASHPDIALFGGRPNAGAANSGGAGIFTQAPNADFNSGLIDLYTGPTSGTGNSGDIFVGSGDSVNGNSGSINIYSGTPSGSGTRGSISLSAKQVNVSVADNLSMGSKPIVNMADPTNAQDAATKNYVDTNAILSSEKGANNGVAPLDAGGKIAASYLPNTVMEYQGNWNASTNSPALADGVGNTGDVWRVNVAGTQDLGSGSITFAIGDFVIYNGSVWEKSVNSNDVVSVNGQQGVVSLDTDDISEGVTNLYFTDARAKSAAVSDSITDGVTDVAPSQNAVFDALALKLANVVEDTTPQLGGDLDVNGKAIEDAANEILLAGANAVRRAKQASKTNFVEEEYIHSITLSASQTDAVISALSFAHATFEGCEVTYKVKEDTSGDIRIGTLRVVSNGTNVSITDTFTDTAETGISFSAAVNGANVEIKYSSGANGAVMRADVKRIKA